MSYSPEALEKAAPLIRILADMEHLDAHANAVDLRIKKINK
jgi:histidinol dehydrogenase